MPREPKLEFLKGRVSPAVKQKVEWKTQADIEPDKTAVLYLDKEAVEITSDKPLVVTIERRRQGGSDRYAINIDVKD